MPTPQEYINHMRKILNKEIEKTVYEPLEGLISFDGFDWHMWLRDEQEVLTPRLKELGYTDIFFSMGDYDEFGPLTRICRAIGPSGLLHWFVYG